MRVIRFLKILLAYLIKKKPKMQPSASWLPKNRKKTRARIFARNASAANNSQHINKNKKLL